jgi:hypothetical protein
LNQWLKPSRGDLHVGVYEYEILQSGRFLHRAELLEGSVVTAGESIVPVKTYLLY